MKTLPIKFNYFMFFIVGFMACLFMIQPKEVVTNIGILILLTWIYLAWALYELTHNQSQKKTKKD